LRRTSIMSLKASIAPKRTHESIPSRRCSLLADRARARAGRRIRQRKRNREEDRSSEHRLSPRQAASRMMAGCRNRLRLANTSWRSPG
jgi:hypothetical protein